MAQRLKPNLYNTLIQCLYTVFNNTPSATRPEVIATNAEIDIGRIDVTGSAYDIWDRILSCAQEENKIIKVIEIALQRSGLGVLKNLLLIINNGQAFLEEITTVVTDTDTKVKRERVKIFLNYNKADALYKENLVDYLNPVRSPFNSNPLPFDFFDMHSVITGENKKEVIEKELEKSDIVLLFLSISFLNKDDGYCYSPLTTRAYELGKKIVPIYVRKGSYGRLKLIGGTVPLPSDEEPLADKEGRGVVMDGVYDAMALSIASLVKNML